jgi:hypothetical protein
MSTEKARWAKLAGLPKTIDKQQLDENFIGHQMVGNIFDREKEKYEDAFEYFLSERYEKEENLEEGPTLNKKEIPTGPGKQRIPLKVKEIPKGPGKQRIPLKVKEIPTGEDKPRIKLNRKEIPTGEEIEEELATPQQLDLISLKSNIIRAAQSFTNKEDLENHILGLIDEIDDDLFDMEIEVDLFDKR